MEKMQEAGTGSPADLDDRIARRVKLLRGGLGLTIDGLAEKSGVSRAMISKIERGDVSPTAVLLGRLANALGTTLSRMFADDAEAGPLVRSSQRPVWKDPATGYFRRSVTPDTAPIDIVDVTLPPGASVTYDNAVPLSLDQTVWVLEGKLRMEVSGEIHDLEQGDCLQMRLDQRISFQNLASQPVRYAVVLLKGAR